MTDEEYDDFITDERITEEAEYWREQELESINSITNKDILDELMAAKERNEALK